MEIAITQIPLAQIDPPTGPRALHHVEELMASIREVGLLQPILVTPKPPRYRLIAGWRRYHACKGLGWDRIPTIVREVDELHEELTRIDENLERQELTILERGEHFLRRKEIYEALHPDTKHGRGPGRGHREKKRKDFASFAADTASKTGHTPRTIQQEVQIAAQLSDTVKAVIRPLAIADKKSQLLQLARLPSETQEVIAHQLSSGRAISVHEAQRAVNGDIITADLAPKTRRIPRARTPALSADGGKVDLTNQDTLLDVVIAQLIQVPVIADGEIAGQPAAAVLAQRLAALPRPELLLLAGGLTGQMPAATAAWVVAVHAETETKPESSGSTAHQADLADHLDAADTRMTCHDHSPQRATVTPSAPPPSTGSEALDGKPHACPVAAVTNVTAWRANGNTVGLPALGVGMATESAWEPVLPHERRSEGDVPAPPLDAPEASVDTSSPLDVTEQVGCASNADPFSAKVSGVASAFPVQLCPKCGSPDIWRI